MGCAPNFHTRKPPTTVAFHPWNGISIWNPRDRLFWRWIYHCLGQTSKTEVEWVIAMPMDACTSTPLINAGQCFERWELWENCTWVAKTADNSWHLIQCIYIYSLCLFTQRIIETSPDLSSFTAVCFEIGCILNLQSQFIIIGCILNFTKLYP